VKGLVLLAFGVVLAGHGCTGSHGVQMEVPGEAVLDVENGRSVPIDVYLLEEESANAAGLERAPARFLGHIGPRMTERLTLGEVEEGTVLQLEARATRGGLAYRGSVRVREGAARWWVP
jgi:hypothetical protein